MLKKINTVTQFQIPETSAININTLPLAANGLCGMQQSANFIGNLFFRNNILFASESVNFERKTNQDISVLDDLCSKDLPEQIPEDVADEIITDAIVLIFKKHIRKSFNGLD